MVNRLIGYLGKHAPPLHPQLYIQTSFTDSPHTPFMHVSPENM